MTSFQKGENKRSTRFRHFQKIVDQLSDNINEFHIESDVEDADEEMGEVEMKENDDNHSYCVLSIDIGVINLGISLTILDEEYNIQDITWIDLIDITNFVHERGPKKEDCTLSHTKTFCDWLNHVFQENIDIFEKADYILIERQPPQGFVVIEQLIFSRWREKAILISPNSMHSYFKIGHLDYDQRKDAVDKIARMKITNPELLEQIDFYHRSHDIADSICLMLFWTNKQHTEYKDKQRRDMIMQRRLPAHKGMTLDEWFDCFRYIPQDN